MGRIKTEEQTESYLRPGQFYGHILKKHNCCGLTLSELKHESARKLPEHSHELAFFCLVLDGDYREQYGAKKVEYQPFTVLFHPPGLTHHDEIGHSGARFFNVELQSQWIARLGEYSTVPATSVDLHGGEMVWLATRLYREYREMNACAPLAIEGLALEMLATVARTKEPSEKRAPSWLARAVDLLHADFHQNLTVNQVAAEIGVHPFHLSKVFRQFHHQSIGEYTHKLRVHFACQQLLQPEIELADVALQAGFADQSHFTRIFKQITGLTPGAFRAAMMSDTTQKPVLLTL